MARQQINDGKGLRENIGEYPERSLALALLGGFAIGGGLSSRFSFQIILMALEGILGDWLIQESVSNTDRNGRRPRNKR
jgi:hypothetical protein